MMEHNLTEENYYSDEANYEYMSVSQYKDFAGCIGRMGCEAAALAKLTGEYETETTSAMLIGSYVDHYFEGTLDSFREEHPEIFKRDGGLKADFVKAEKVIERAERDELFMNYMSGEKQVIMVGELFGTKWKCKLDSYIPGKAIVDLKVMSSLTKLHYDQAYGYLDFVRYWGYDIQGAIYQEIVRQNTGEKLPFYITGLSKETEPDIEVIHVVDLHLKEALKEVERNINRVLAVKNRQTEPDRCCTCDYCKRTKVLTHPIGLDMIVEKAVNF